MNDKKSKILKLIWKVYLIFLALFTVLYFVRVKFLVFHMNIIFWDIITAVIYILATECKWATREDWVNRGIATSILVICLIWGSFLFIRIFFEGSIYQYVEGTEPQTHRTFVVEYRCNMMRNGKARLYERFGPVIIPCDVEEYEGEISPRESERVYLADSGEYIVVSFFFLEPAFFVELE